MALDTVCFADSMHDPGTSLLIWSLAMELLRFRASALEPIFCGRALPWNKFLELESVLALESVCPGICLLSHSLTLEPVICCDRNLPWNTFVDFELGL